MTKETNNKPSENQPKPVAPKPNSPDPGRHREGFGDANGGKGQTPPRGGDRPTKK